MRKTTVAALAFFLLLLPLIPPAAEEKEEKDPLREPVITIEYSPEEESPYSESDLELLARIIFSEARGEPYLGKVAVGAVVLNRVESDLFPSTIEEVIFQENQFCGAGNANFNGDPCEDSYRAAEAALLGENPVEGALYFLNHRIAGHPRWIKSKTFVKKIGEHSFYE